MRAVLWFGRKRIDRKREALLLLLYFHLAVLLCVELMQLPLSARATDIDDLLMNPLGAALGYGLYASVKLIRRLR